MADSLLSEIEKEKAASKRVMYQLQTDLEEVLELIAEDWRNQQRDIDLFNRINYMQGYKDREQGKKLGYPLEDDEEEKALEDTKKETSKDEGNDEHKESEDTEETEKGKEVRSVAPYPRRL